MFKENAVFAHAHAGVSCVGMIYIYTFFVDSSLPLPPAVALPPSLYLSRCPSISVSVSCVSCFPLSWTCGVFSASPGVPFHRVIPGTPNVHSIHVYSIQPILAFWYSLLGSAKCWSSGVCTCSRAADVRGQNVVLWMVRGIRYCCVCERCKSLCVACCLQTLTSNFRCKYRFDTEIRRVM